MPSIITPTQCGFIHGRTGSNNIIIAQEVIQKMHQMKGQKGFMAIKIDLEKAYDKLDGQFLLYSLKDARFSNHFCNLVWHYVSSASMNVLWNGDCTAEFFPTHGIRQGDLLSPYLFVLCIERLSHLIQAAVSQGSGSQ